MAEAGAAAFPYKIVIDKGDGTPAHTCWTDWSGVFPYPQEEERPTGGTWQLTDSPAAPGATAPGRRLTFTTGGGVSHDGRLSGRNTDLFVPGVGECAVVYWRPGEHTMTFTTRWLLASEEHTILAAGGLFHNLRQWHVHGRDEATVSTLNVRVLESHTVPNYDLS